MISELEIEGIFVRKYNKEIKTSYNGNLLFDIDEYNNAKEQDWRKPLWTFVFETLVSDKNWEKGSKKFQDLWNLH